MTKEIKYISLFSGVGGFEKAIENASNNIKRLEERGSQERRDRNIDERRDMQHPETEPSLCDNGPIQQEDAKRSREHNCTEDKLIKWKCVGFSELDPFCTTCKTYTKHTYISKTRTKCDTCGKEKTQHASSIYQYRFPNHPSLGDATKIDTGRLPEIDFLCGGFPCQAFSIAGSRRGFEDTRGTLFFEVARVLKAKRPKAFLLENVKGLLNHNKGRTFATILDVLGSLDYDVQVLLLNSKFFGVPQNRERVFFVGHIRDGSPRKVLSFGSDDQKASDEGCSQEEQQIAQTMRARDYANWNGNFVEARTLRTHKDGNGFRKMKELISPQCKGWNDWNGQPIIKEVTGKRQGYRVYKPDGISPNLNSQSGGITKYRCILVPEIAGTLTGGGHSRGLHSDMTAIPVLTPDGLEKRQNGRRFKEDGEEMFTLNTQDKHGVMIMNTVQESVGSRQGSSNSFKASVKNIEQATGIIRGLTPKECELLQGFPVDFTKYGIADSGIVKISDSQRYKAMGNAVTVNVVQAIIEKMIEVGYFCGSTKPKNIKGKET